MIILFVSSLFYNICWIRFFDALNIFVIINIIIIIIIIIIIYR